MLVIYGHILRPINCLHLPQQVLMHLFFTLDLQDIPGNNRAIDEWITRLDLISGVNPEVLSRGNNVWLRIAA